MIARRFFFVRIQINFMQILLPQFTRAEFVKANYRRLRRRSDRGSFFCFCFHIFAVAQLCFYRRLEPIITARYSNLPGPWPVLMPIRSSISTKTSLNTGEETFLFCARAKQFSVISRVFLGKHFGMLIICNYSKIPWPDDSLAMRHRSNGGIIRILICLVF